MSSTMAAKRSLAWATISAALGCRLGLDRRGQGGDVGVGGLADRSARCTEGGVGEAVGRAAAGPGPKARYST